MIFRLTINCAGLADGEDERNDQIRQLLCDAGGRLDSQSPTLIPLRLDDVTVGHFGFEVER